MQGWHSSNMGQILSLTPSNFHWEKVHWRRRRKWSWEGFELGFFRRSNVATWFWKRRRPICCGQRFRASKKDFHSRTKVLQPSQRVLQFWRSLRWLHGNKSGTPLYIPITRLVRYWTGLNLSFGWMVLFSNGIWVQDWYSDVLDILDAILYKTCYRDYI